jgi:hypothetical protein
VTRGAPVAYDRASFVFGSHSASNRPRKWSRRRCRLDKARQYALGPGQTQAYSSGLIHSTAHPQKAWVIRITGTDLDAIPRYHSRAKTDKIVEAA